ncbi:MAG: protein kinase [Polyangiaceae bacterium]|nr:protein kinase [Polyangiaceae bacterium]
MTEAVVCSEGLPNVGDVVAGKYRIERVLGKGSMGMVYRAQHEILRKPVAIKMVLPQLADIPAIASRFVNEARAAARIRSEHVAQVLDVGRLENGIPFMVLELLEGQDLSDFVEGFKEHLPIASVVDIVLEALEALALAHSLGIVHRDLKPSNIFLAHRPDGSCVVKVLDFGISKATTLSNPFDDTAVTLTNVSLGTPAYMSPEQIRNAKHVDARADIWSIGVILYTLLTKTDPFVGDSVGAVFASILEDTPKRLRAIRPEVPEVLDNVVIKCLERDRRRRYANVAELAKALAPMASTAGQGSAERVCRTPVARNRGGMDAFAVETLIDGKAPPARRWMIRAAFVALIALSVFIVVAPQGRRAEMNGPRVTQVSLVTTSALPPIPTPSSSAVVLPAASASVPLVASTYPPFSELPPPTSQAAGKPTRTQTMKPTGAKSANEVSIDNVLRGGRH